MLVWIQWGQFSFRTSNQWTKKTSKKRKIVQNTSSENLRTCLTSASASPITVNRTSSLGSWVTSNCKFLEKYMRLTLCNAYCQLCFWNCQLSNAEYYDLPNAGKMFCRSSKVNVSLFHIGAPILADWVEPKKMCTNQPHCWFFVYCIKFWMLDSPCAESNYHTWGSQPPTLPTLQHHPWRIFSKQWYFECDIIKQKRN